MIQLSPIEARIIGVLLEKEVTTPDYYPMTINALTNACNQKNCRIPVTAFINDEVAATVLELENRGLVAAWVSGQRTPKYKHRFCNTEFSELQFTDKEKAIVCELLLRGPQSAGELKARAGRMVSFDDVQEVDAIINELQSKSFISDIGRIHGKRDAHFMHNFASGEAIEPSELAVCAAQPNLSSEQVVSVGTEISSSTHTDSTSATIEQRASANLNDRVTKLEDELAELKELINTLL